MQFVTITSGSTSSPRFRLDRADRLLGVHAASAAASAVFLAFSTSSAGQLTRLCRPDGSGAFFAVASGNEGWCVVCVPTPFGRIEQSIATTDTRTFGLFTVHG